LKLSSYDVPAIDDPDGRHDLSSSFKNYTGRQVSYYTHGIHRFPAKFIPQVPRFCLERYSKPGDAILDPFMGSGTTLLEALLLGRDAYGIDIHPLAKLIAKVKVTSLPIERLKAAGDRLLADISADANDNSDWIPEMPNFDHWFREDVALNLATIKKHIWSLPDDDIRDFLKVCFSSIIRRVSNSDVDSLMPEVTTFKRKLVEQGKVDFNVMSRFENTVRLKTLDFADLAKALVISRKKYKRESEVEIIGKDARSIELRDSEVDAAITSPPYASAVHYVTAHKLEMYWLDMMEPESELETRIIGTARAYAEEYNSWEPGGLHPEVDILVRKIYLDDQKSGYIVHKYFADMRQSFEEVLRVLKRNGIFCVVAGENVMKGTKISTYHLLDQLAQQVGFERKALFDYDIINRHLDVPRWNNSTIIQDHILVLEK
jgi:DNA modification methylase